MTHPTLALQRALLADHELTQRIKDDAAEIESNLAKMKAAQVQRDYEAVHVYPNGRFSKEHRGWA